MRRPSARCFLFPLLIVVSLIAPNAVHAQTVSLDEGTFRLLKGGDEVGTERFTIRQSGSGGEMVIIAQGTVVIDTTGTPEETRSTLRVEGPTLRPAAYDVTQRGTDTQRIAGRVVGSRFSARILSSTGEQMREYLASNGAVLVDEGVAHHHFFLARRADGGSTRMPVIIPRQNRQVSAQVAEHGRETIRIGGRSIDARRLTVTPAGAPERHVWVDEQSRVLRLTIPDQRFEAVRTTVPR